MRQATPRSLPPTDSLSHGPRDRFIRAAALALVSATLHQGEDGYSDTADLHELAALLREVLYDACVMAE